MQAFLWGVLGVYILLAFLFGLQNNIKSLKFFICCILVQNIFLIAFSHFMSSTLCTLFTLVKEIMLYEMAIIGLIKSYKIIPKRIIILSLILITICIKNVIFSNSNIWARIITLRQVLIPLICLMTGFGLKANGNTVCKLNIFIIKVSLLVAIVGIIELFIGDSFWIKLGYLDYLSIKEGEVSGVYNGVTTNFYTWDIGKLVIRRIVSFTADPLATAHWLFIGFILCYMQLKVTSTNVTNCSINFKRNKKYSYILLICCILTFSKAVFVLMAIAIVFLIYSKTKKSYRWILVLFVSLAFGLLIMLIGYNSLISQNDTATSIHFNGLLDGIRYSSIFGNGFGTAGFVASFTGTEIQVGESFFGVTTYQIGWVGIIAYMLILITVLCEFINQNKKTELLTQNFGIIITLGLMVEMLFSESSVSILGTSIYFILIGLLYKQSVNLKYSIKKNHKSYLKVSREVQLN